MKRIFRLTISTHFSDSGLYFSMCRFGRIPSNLCCWRVIIKALQTINEHSDGNRWGNVNKLCEHNPTVLWVKASQVKMSRKVQIITRSSKQVSLVHDVRD